MIYLQTVKFSIHYDKRATLNWVTRFLMRIGFKHVNYRKNILVRMTVPGPSKEFITHEIDYRRDRWFASFKNRHPDADLYDETRGWFLPFLGVGLPKASPSVCSPAFRKWFADARRS